MDNTVDTIVGKLMLTIDNKKSNELAVVIRF